MMAMPLKIAYLGTQLYNVERNAVSKEVSCSQPEDNQNSTTSYEGVEEQTAKKWDNAEETFASGGAWHQHKLVVKTLHERKNNGREVKGAPEGWKLYLDHIHKKYGARSKCISIGCGDGKVEMIMVEIGLCETAEGIDLSPVRVERANKYVNFLSDRLDFQNNVCAAWR